MPPPYILEPGRRVNAWDYEFEWTSDHYTPEQLKPLIYTYDELASKALDRLDEIAAESRSSKSSPPQSNPGSEPYTDTSPPQQCPNTKATTLFSLLQSHPHDPLLSPLWTQLTTTPPWVSLPQISRGQQIIYRYLGPSIVGLTFQALLGGFGSSRISTTLSLTGGFSPRFARRRLLETFQHVLDITSSVPDITPPLGKGFISTVKVRLLHATVRRKILTMARQKPSWFDISANGIPCNDLDSIGTITAFSTMLLFIGFPRQGIYLSRQEKEDYLALWRYIAHLLGTPTAPFENISTAKIWLESLIVSEIHPSKISKQLGENMITSLALTPPTYASAEFLRAEGYWLNGPALSKALGIGRPKWWYLVLVAGQCGYFMGVSYGKKYLLPKSWEEKQIGRLKRMMREMTVREAGGREAGFEFRYVPSWKQLHNDSNSDNTIGGDEKGVGEDVEAKKRDGFRNRWTEWRNLMAAVLLLTVVGWVAWLSVRVVCRGVVGMVTR
ncbi:hypothetical protein QBC40DRAFT_353458 [Triangularia verruculosa]|uniref:ER-bound oxygenase mpaB/mpaB'/Rubber oxygenase catalytic domain-containing protein n=1 Tax=Triangularia verruculosa TaxID=2587418 RepID=A0AAN6XAC1_9PEZI|nr:hypothetical protein QBC40DRAFT_353458 [Triangularia verruculosa]